MVVIMTEKGMWRRIRKMLEGRGHGVRVEASLGDSGVGTPDSVITLWSRTRWVELKVWGTPLSREQIVWAMVRDTAAGEDDGVLVMGYWKGKWWLGRWTQWVDGKSVSGKWYKSLLDCMHQEWPRVFVVRD